MHHSSFDLRDFVSGALSRNKPNGSDEPKKVDMLCEGCRTKLGLAAFKRKKQCGECHLTYCSNCLSLPHSEGSTTPSPNAFSRFIDRSTSKQYCSKCHVLRARPLCRADLQRLRVKDLQHYLRSHDVSCKGCVEKEDLVNLLIRYVGSTGSYNDIRQTSSAHGESHQPNCSGESGPGNFSDPHPARRSSDPDIHSPTDTSSQMPSSNTSQCSSRPSTLEPSQSTNPSRSEMQSEFTAMPEVSSPVSDTDSITNRCCDMGDTNRRIVVEELTDWELVEPEAAESGPEPVVTEVDDEPTNVQNNLSESNNIDDSGQIEGGDVPVQVEEQNEDNEPNSNVQGSQAEDSPIQVSKRVELSSIKCLDDLELLTVKQLKELLVRNRVDFRGCVEKAELTERVNRLWLESVQARKELETMSMDELCKICMDAPVECVMLECGHMATCTTCGKQLNECPICRQYVVRVVRIFKA